MDICTAAYFFSIKKYHSEMKYYADKLSLMQKWQILIQQNRERELKERAS